MDLEKREAFLGDKLKKIANKKNGIRFEDYRMFIYSISNIIFIKYFAY